MTLDVTAAILAGGLGIRLRSAVADRPKILAEVGGRPFLSYLLDQVSHSGIRHVVLCTGHRAQQVRTTYGDAYGNVSIQYSEESSPVGTAGALRYALPHYKSEWVLAMNGDSFCGIDLESFALWHFERGAQASMVLVASADARAFGHVLLDRESNVAAFEEKGDERRSGWINAGIYLLHLSLVAEIPEDRPVSLEREMIPSWIARGISGYTASAAFVDIGTPATYAAAEQILSEANA